MIKFLLTTALLITFAFSHILEPLSDDLACSVTKVSAYAI